MINNRNTRHRRLDRMISGCRLQTHAAGSVHFQDHHPRRPTEPHWQMPLEKRPIESFDPHPGSVPCRVDLSSFVRPVRCSGFGSGICQTLGRSVVTLKAGHPLLQTYTFRFHGITRRCRAAGTRYRHHYPNGHRPKCERVDQYQSSR